MSQMHYLFAFCGRCLRLGPESSLPLYSPSCLEEFYSETGAVLASYASDPDAPFCDEVSSKEARDP